ncbi:MAG: hypothetical protein ACOVKS_11315, partial [Aquimonas sp.]
DGAVEIEICPFSVAQLTAPQDVLVSKKAGAPVAAEEESRAEHHARRQRKRARHAKHLDQRHADEATRAKVDPEFAKRLETRRMQEKLDRGEKTDNVSRGTADASSGVFKTSTTFFSMLED